ncbi:RNA polymerase sigma factor [Aliikangiella coralliicola]|uniref:RNA polymerase sigma factor n=1 Tax=Aliikangiella coralliicola TaxID=2592383 RepID=A0A545U004_9GAMM|nr:RNA polymerase sigma factor [Aliikangiella coralliicola]TQV82798.1 RNA polymerase sigma factor [Aliikangiella coralliicola]
MHDQDALIDLLARCALKDQQALKQLYERLSPYLNRVAFNIVRSDDLSNEVLQEAFVQIWNNAGDYRPDKSKPITWLTSITRYRALDRLAKEKRHSENRSENIELDSVHAENSSPEDKAVHGQQQGDLLACMKTLNERARTCITMAYIQGYSRDDLANKFNTNVNTIKSWLHRGSKRLKECLDQKTQIA